MASFSYNNLNYFNCLFLKIQDYTNGKYLNNIIELLPECKYTLIMFHWISVNCNVVIGHPF